MTLTRFRYLLDAYGADLRRWPAAEQDDAAALLAASPEAAEARRAAQRLDRSLEAVAPEIGDESIDRVLDALARTPMPAQQPAAPPPKRPTAYRWLPPVLLGAVAILGFLTGLQDLDEESLASSRAGLVGSTLTSRLGL
jgi:hypothetical protein